jgi:RND superfamily putative drug exporter
MGERGPGGADAGDMNSYPGRSGDHPDHLPSLPFTVRVASWSARHRWPVLALWFVCTFGLFAASLAMGGQRVLSTEESRTSIGESARGDAVLAAAGDLGATVRQRFTLVVSGAGGSLDTTAGRDAVASIVSAMAAARTTVDGATVRVFDGVTDPFDPAIDPAMAAFLVSSDGSTVLVDATVDGSPDEIRARIGRALSLVRQLATEHPELDLQSLNTTLLETELMEYAGSSTGFLLLISLPLTFAILLVAFRALVAATVPLALGLSTVVGGMGIVATYSRLVGPVSPFAVEFVVLIGLAVAIDYSLFVIGRFRTERNTGRDRIEAIEAASSTAGRAVAFSGIAVAISMAGLFLLDNPLVASFAVGSISAVLVAVAGTMTFLPAALSVLDRRIDRGAVPFLSAYRPEGRGFWARVVGMATRRAVLVATLTGGLLAVASLPLVDMKLGYSANDLASMPQELDTVRAARAIENAWPAGSSVTTLDVIVTDAAQPETRAAMARLEAAALALDGVGGPSRMAWSTDGTVAELAFSLAGNASDPGNAEIVRTVRDEVVPTAFAGVPSDVYVSGDAAYDLDYAGFYAGKAVLVVGFVLGFSFLLLLAAFRSIAIPLKAIVLNLLSFGTAFGVLVAVFHGSGVIDAANPVMVFAILFGLSMDYHVFILSRVKEEHDRGVPTEDAVLTGISATSGTVTSAAAIMVCVFAGFGTIGIANIAQFGLGMAIAVFVDATLVRSLLLPATMKLLGEWNWWLPPFLRWLPRIEIEGTRSCAV